MTMDAIQIKFSQQKIYCSIAKTLSSSICEKFGEELAHSSVIE